MECCGGCNKDNKRELINNIINKIRNKYADEANNDKEIQLLYKITEEIKQKIEEIL